MSFGPHPPSDLCVNTDRSPRAAPHPAQGMAAATRQCTRELDRGFGMDAPARQRTWAELHHALQGLRERQEGHYRGQPLHPARLSRGLATAHPHPQGLPGAPAAPGGGVGTSRPTWREWRVGGQARPEAGS